VPIVVCALGGEEDPLGLPRSAFVERAIRGGERSLYELAVAVAAAGREVELRGLIAERDLSELAEAAGAWPRVGLEPRRPTAEDLVVVPEGHPEPLPYARLALSPARAVLMLLAPPGLFGWPFTIDWPGPDDPTAVPLDSLARPEHFRAMAAAGFELWTHSPGLSDRIMAAGVPCTWIGSGTPIRFPDAGERPYDVVALKANRWAPLARRVLTRIDATHRVIDEVPHRRLLQLLGTGRILAWPSRVEGHSRIQLEARAVGTVPVAFDSNPFASGLDEKGGAVLVGSLDEMAEEIERLLAAPDRLAELSGRARRSARAELDWEAYVTRVDAALRFPPAEDPGRGARARLGTAVERSVRDLLGVKVAEVEGRARQAEAREHRAMGRAEQAEARARAAVAQAESAARAHGEAVERLRSRDGELAELRAVRRRRSVRLALAVAALARPYFVTRAWIRRRFRPLGRDPAPPVGRP
jgi:glycosyl transferase family 1